SRDAAGNCGGNREIPLVSRKTTFEGAAAMKPEKPFDPELDAALDRDIAKLLSVEPSPEFLARVRTRIAKEPEPSTWNPRWLLVAASAAASVAAAAVVFTRVMIPVQEPVPVTAPTAVADVTVEHPVQPTLAPKPAAQPAVRKLKTAKAGLSEPKLLIPPGE